jgi:hypothetical protein
MCLKLEKTHLLLSERGWLPLSLRSRIYSLRYPVARLRVDIKFAQSHRVCVDCDTVLIYQFHFGQAVTVEVFRTLDFLCAMPLCWAVSLRIQVLTVLQVVVAFLD